MTKINKEKCLKCRSQNLYRCLLKGFDVGVGERWELTARRVKAQVCLDCGYIELRLNEKDIEKLKKKTKKEV